MAATKAKTAKPKTTLSWLCYRVAGPKAVFLGRVNAPDQETALAVAWEKFNVTTPAERKRIIVRQTGSGEQGFTPPR